MKLSKLLTPIVIIALCALLVFGVTTATAGLRESNEQAYLLNRMQTVLPGSTEFTLEEYTGEDETICSTYKSDVGYAVFVVPHGYAGDIAMLVGVSNDGLVTGMQVQQMQETYGLGAQALTDYKFLVQFLNTDGSAEIGTNVDALTGATVTSKAIARGVNSAVAFVTGADTSSSATSWGG